MKNPDPKQTVRPELSNEELHRLQNWCVIAIVVCVAILVWMAK